MLGFLFIFIGLLHYLTVREFLPLYGQNLSLPSLIQDSWIPQLVFDSLPSFIFVLSLILIDDFFSQKIDIRSKIRTCSKWLAIALFFEGIQALPMSLGYFSGVFDWNDCFASLLGSCFAYLLLTDKNYFKKVQSWGRNLFLIIPTWVTKISIYAITFVMITATSGHPPKMGPCSAPEDNSPLNIKWLDPRPIISNAKITAYENFLFISDSSGGVHVLDNSDPRKPIPYGFIDIPGNEDIAVKDHIIYANSYKHMVAIDATALPEIKIIKTLHYALGRRLSHCQEDRRILPNRDRVEQIDPIVVESVQEEMSPQASRIEELQCLFTSPHDACLVLIENQDSLILTGCMVENSEESNSENKFSCSIELPVFSRILSHLNICGEQDTAHLLGNESSRYLDFWESSCKSPEEKDEHLPSFQANFTAYDEQVDFVSNHQNFTKLVEALNLNSTEGDKGNE